MRLWSKTCEYKIVTIRQDSEEESAFSPKLYNVDRKAVVFTVMSYTKKFQCVTRTRIESVEMQLSGKIYCFI